MTELYINGRFVTQPQSGVQRFAGEVARALIFLGGDSAHLNVPLNGAAIWPGAQETGRLQGHAWEQWELPRHVQSGVLVNLGNTAPLRVRRQVVVIHDAGVFSTPEAYSPKFRLWYKIMQHVLVRRGVPIVTVSEFSRQEIMRHLGAKPDQVTVMPEGADHMHRIISEPAILQQHNLQPGRYVLAVGNLAAHKNLGALAVLAKNLPTHGMVLAVAGNLVNRAFSSSGEQLLPDAVRFLGRVSDGGLKALYESAACFVFPSRYEGFGLPAVEAMASGCPVIASNIPALRETCQDAAVYFDPEAPEDISTQVLKLCLDTGLQNRLRGAGTKFTETMTWQFAAEKLRKIIATTDMAFS